MNDYIQSRLAKVTMLPTFPEIAGKVAAIIEDPKSSASDLAQYMDPSMVSEVLRIANSAYVGTGSFRKITSLEHAIAVIGFEDLLYIILHMPFISMTKGDGGAFDRKKFISHSILCGALAKGLSLGLKIGDPNEVYLGGIEHDVGVIVIYRYFEEEWNAVAKLMSDLSLSRIEAERRVLSVDHGHIGGALLDMWNTPKPIADCVRYHHEPEMAEENRDNVAIVHLANDLAKGIDIAHDLKSFDTFATKYRIALRTAFVAAQELSPSEEIALIEGLYDLLKGAKAYIESITKEKDD